MNLRSKPFSPILSAVPSAAVSQSLPVINYRMWLATDTCCLFPIISPGIKCFTGRSLCWVLFWNTWESSGKGALPGHFHAAQDWSWMFLHVAVSQGDQEIRYTLFNIKFEEKLPRWGFTGSSHKNQTYDPICPEALILQCAEDLLTGVTYPHLLLA